jgi:hypothetical protein
MIPPDEKFPDDVLWHQSGVNAKGEPLVQLIRGTDVIAQMSPEQARDHARSITEAAEASEQDAFFVWFLQHEVGVSKEQAFGVLMDFRRKRAERTGKRGGLTSPRDWVMPEGAPSITCPKCGKTSYNLKDIERGYCGFSARSTTRSR